MEDVVNDDVLHRILKGNAWMDYVTPSFWDGEFRRPVTKEYRITIVTTCMDRLDDLKETYIKNMSDNWSYKNVDFLLLDYNSTKDDVVRWVKNNGKLQRASKAGRFSFFRTEDPRYYSMAHSRNICFRLASGDIVLSVDADNFTNKGFAEYVNRLANQEDGKMFFAKGKRMLRGRLGFFKDDFVNILGGYDESLEGYGHEDHDLMHRAWGAGLKMMWFGGKFYKATSTPKHDVTNYRDKRWRYTEKRNKILSFFNVAAGFYKANVGVEWGKATFSVY